MVAAFGSPGNVRPLSRHSCPARLQMSAESSDESLWSRRQVGSQLVAGALTILIGVQPVNAEETPAETDPPVATYSIEKCVTSSKKACVSTANVRNLDLYIPPWTFDRPVDEVMSRLKGAIVADPSTDIVKQDGNQYLKATAERKDLFSTIDELEFVISEKDQVIFCRSIGTNEQKDFGANKRRLEEIRKRAGIFGVMGEYMNSADSASVGDKGYGPLGQLKAFYGLQSGGGYEDIVLEN